MEMVPTDMYKRIGADTLDDLLLDRSKERQRVEIDFVAARSIAQIPGADGTPVYTGFIYSTAGALPFRVQPDADDLFLLPCLMDSGRYGDNNSPCTVRGTLRLQPTFGFEHLYLDVDAVKYRRGLQSKYWDELRPEPESQT